MLPFFALRSEFFFYFFIFFTILFGNSIIIVLLVVRIVFTIVLFFTRRIVFIIVCIFTTSRMQTNAMHTCVCCLCLSISQQASRISLGPFYLQFSRARN